MTHKYVSDSKRMSKPLLPGARVQCRDAQWMVHNCVYAGELQSFLVEVEGMEGLVEGLQASFLLVGIEFLLMDTSTSEIIIV